jgi:hypothetical protein
MQRLKKRTLCPPSSQEAAVAGFLSLGAIDTGVKVTPLRNGQDVLTHRETMDEQQYKGCKIVLI